MAATLSGRPAETEPRDYDAGHRLPAAGGRPWRRVQSDAAPINDLGRGRRRGPPERLEPRRMAMRNAPKATTTAPPITNASDGSHAPPRSRKPSTLIGSV